MEILFNAVGSSIVEVGKFVSKCIYPKIENIVRFSSKIENLREEMVKLTKLRDDIKGKVEEDEGKGYKPKPDVLKWIEDVCELEKEWTSMQERIAAAKTLAYKCCPKFSLRSEVSTQVQNIRDQLCRLIQVGESFGSNLMVENYQVPKVEFIPGPSIEGQSAARRNLNEILRLLEDDEVSIIGVWGAGGIGKTTLVKNLNNELQQIDVSRPKLSFGVVVWVTVPKPPIDIREIQAQVASRLKVDNEGSVQSNASKIYQRFKEEKSFLLILDDVWEPINLEDVGVPQPGKPARSKVIITSRFLDVCKKMKVDTEMRVNTLDEYESWQLFVTNAGDVAKREDIQQLAMDIARECGGLPLAITVIGTSMRGKTRVELWKDALTSIRMSEPHHKDVEKMVYMVIKWSFDSLESQEQKSKHMNKRRGDIQNCFLYCSLYPADISTDHLIYSWWAEGFLGEHDTYEGAYNRGTTMIESLKDACLLEETQEMPAFWKPQQVDYVKMHDVVRDVAKWIDNSFGKTEVSASVKRISFVSKRIQSLPDNFTECPETTSLLLQDNYRIFEIPHGFLLAFPALRVLNLSETAIRVLPSSINTLCQLRALILQNCRSLRELPPIGNLCNLQLLDCDNTRLCRLPQGMDMLTNLRLLNMPVVHFEESIGQGFFLKLPKIEMLNMPVVDPVGNIGHLKLPRIKMINMLQWDIIYRTEQVRIKSHQKRVTVVGPTSLDEISSLPNLTSLFIRLDSSSNFNRDYTWMSRLRSFHIEIGRALVGVPFNKSTKRISISHSETSSNRELSGMLQFASHLYLVYCMGLRELIANKSFDGLKKFHIRFCSCDFTPAEEGSGQFDRLPNLEYLNLNCVDNLKSVSDFSQLLGLRFSKLHQLYIYSCHSLTCLFNVGGTFSVPKHLKEITILRCDQLVELFVQCSSSQTTVVTSEIRELLLHGLPKLETFGEPQSIWEHLEELEVIDCNRLRKLPLSIQTSKNIKVIKGSSEWWSQLEWEDDNFKSNLEHCFKR